MMRGTPIEYTDAIYDEPNQSWGSRAEVAETGFTAFSSKNKSEQVSGRLVVRRIPDLNPGSKNGQETLFDIWRLHAFFTTTNNNDLDTVAADKTHRGHAIIEQIHAELKNSALTCHPVCSPRRRWLVLAVIAFNLTRAAATITGPALAKATTPTIRRRLITVPARIASSARDSLCTCRATGPGKTPGPCNSSEHSARQPRSLPDRQPQQHNPRGQPD